MRENSITTTAAVLRIDLVICGSTAVQCRVKLFKSKQNIFI